MESKKEKNYITVISLIFFIIFIILYISKEAGYYEYKSYQKTILTEEAIKRFEKDISEGKDVNINEYVEVEYKDYSNKFTVLGSKLGEVAESVIGDKLTDGLKILGRLFWN